MPSQRPPSAHELSVMHSNGLIRVLKRIKADSDNLLASTHISKNIKAEKNESGTEFYKRFF
jgi:D-alanyl-D-alanine carboxypeptidase